MRLLCNIKSLFCVLAFCLIITNIFAEENIPLNNNSGPISKFQIYSKNEFLFCTGDDPAGTLNNKAADLMLAGKFPEAYVILEEGLNRAPLFFPFRYNAGICTMYMNHLKEALIHLTKASQLVPEYPNTYLHTGYIYGRLNRENEALEQFRICLKKNPGELNTYILIGDIYFDRNQLTTAKKYYETTITLRHSFPNGILGLAKIHFKNKEYVKAIILLKSIDTSADYDKSYHYYFAESAFKTADYKTAVVQYETLLKYKNDKFFLVNSMFLIKHKLELSKRFTER